MSTRKIKTDDFVQLQGKLKAQIISFFEEKYSKALTRYALGRVGPCLATEVVHESFLYLKSMVELSSTEDDIRRFLREMIFKTCAEYTPKLQAIEKICLDLPDSNIEDEDFTACLSLDPIINNLPPQRRKIITFIYWQGLSTAEICSLLNLKRQTVINQKVRALKAMKTDITKYLKSQGHW